MLNGQLEYLLDYFEEETDHGKLYINYPMIESIKYTKELPDSNYYQYTVSREDCRSFKRVAASFSFYPNMDFLLRGDAQSRARSWELLKIQNVAKANFLCNGVNEYPPVEMGSISQRTILQHQIDEFESLPDCRLSVLSSYPIMMFEWLGK